MVPAFDARHALAEGPVWHDGRLWWVDILGHSLHAGDPASGAWRSRTFPRAIGAAVPTERGDWLLALEDGIYRWRDGLAEPRLLAAPGDPRPHTRFNDGKVDPAGRFWAGTMDWDAAPGGGALYSLDPGADHLVTRRAPVSISNGLAWDAPRERFYYLDSPTRRLTVTDWDPASGALGTERTVLDLSDETGLPDGMALDREGHLWIALWGGAQVLKVDPRAGRVRGRISLPATQVTSCAFGGPALETLFITTARVGLDEAALKDQPHAGGIFALEPGTGGLPPTLFAG
jgi:sugar lactone lactonase YvrE